MSRIHIHIAVADLQRSIDFYTTLLGSEPTRRKADYAKWQLDEPKINLAISTRGLAPGINHLGVQAETAEELSEMTLRLAEAGFQGTEESGAGCCYARSDKYWTVDPSGVPWESFHTLDQIPTFDGVAPGAQRESTCCVPREL